MRGVKFVGLQIPLNTNGLPQPSYATIESMMSQLCEWLMEDAAHMLELSQGVKCRGWRPLGDLEPPIVAVGRWLLLARPETCRPINATGKRQQQRWGCMMISYCFLEP